MKKFILITACSLFMATCCYSQVKASEVFSKLSELTDQFDNAYDAAEVTDKLTLIYIPGTNKPFEKIYLKQKASKVKNNVLLVGGFKEMMGLMTRESKKEHLSGALGLQYKKGSTILVDMDSELGQLLEVGGYSIITLSKVKNKIVNLNDFGFDRVAFFKELKKYEIE